MQSDRIANDETQDLQSSISRKREELTESQRKECRQQSISQKRKALQKDEDLSKAVQLFQQQELNLQSFDDLIEKLNKHNILTMLEGLVGIRRLLYEDPQALVQKVVIENVIPKIIEVMKQDRLPEFQRESVQLLSNIATTTACQDVVSRGAVPALVKLLSSRDQKVVLQAVLAIGNIADYTNNHRNLFINAGAITFLSRLAHSTNKSLAKDSLYVLSNLCVCTPAPKYKLVKQAIPVLMGVLAVPQAQRDIDLMASCAWAIARISESNSAAVQLCNSGSIQIIISLLSCPFRGLLSPVLLSLQNICSSRKAKFTTSLVGDSLLPKLLCLLDNYSSRTRGETCRLIAAIAARTVKQAAIVINLSQLNAKLMGLLNSDRNEVQIYICNYLAILAQNSKNVQPLVQYCSRYHVISSLVQLLFSPNTKLLLTVMNLLQKLFGAGQKFKQKGSNLILAEFCLQSKNIQNLERLQMHNSVEVYQKALSLMSTYFEAEEQSNY